ncbi:MAG: ATP synthase F0 subunit B, partial [Bdellovibrionaceae bacterium]|nr:ATP synthase F0 subunit B [Pseudobdellovibrionaceae bacterium]
MKRLTAVIIGLLVLSSSVASASSGAEHGIPGDVKFQLMNLTIFFAILVYFAGGKVVALFKQRYEDFHRVARETEKAKKDLENKKADVIRLMQKLKTTYDQSLVEAQAEAENAMKDQIAKANEEVSRMATEAQAQLKSDYSKQMEKLRLEALEMSIVSAENK